MLMCVCLLLGIAHRDMKPENILCTRPGHVSFYFSVDFVSTTKLFYISIHTYNMCTC